RGGRRLGRHRRRSRHNPITRHPRTRHPMTRPIFVVDAFARGPFRGNPAGVVILEAGDAPDDALMLLVAAEMKHSETAFVRPRNDGVFDLRWFTPEVEVDLCGHA